MDAAVVVQAEGRAGNPNVEMYRNARNRAILGRRTKRDFPWCAAVSEAVTLVVPRTSCTAEVRVECVSNVIYQIVYLIRLIIVSDILSN